MVAWLVMLSSPSIGETIAMSGTEYSLVSSEARQLILQTAGSSGKSVLVGQKPWSTWQGVFAPRE